MNIKQINCIQVNIVLFVLYITMCINTQGISIENYVDVIKLKIPISNAIYSRQLEFKPKGFRTIEEAKKWVQNTNNIANISKPDEEYYWMVYQPEPSAHIFRKIKSISDASNPEAVRYTPFTGHYNTNWWSIDEDTVLLRNYNINNNNISKINICNTAIRYATELLRLGILEIDSKTCKKNKNKCTFNGETIDNMHISGIINTNKEGDVTSANYEINNINTLVLYYYEKKLPLNMPSKIIIKRKYNEETKYKLYCTINIHKFAISDGQIDKNVFSPDRFLKPSDSRMKADWDGTQYLYKNDNWIELPGNDSEPKRPAYNIRMRIIVVLVISIIVVCMFMLIKKYNTKL
ncbi:MAG: hypothetical protein K9N48_04035 [Verrucomicrobia bacterium]|nr:hypothetical protein [Verrucomicrobiota bacterium]